MTDHLPTHASSSSTAGDLAERFRVYCENYSEETRTVEIEGLELLVAPRVYLAEGASTTRALLCALGDTAGKRVLDMGCGSGILGVAAALRGAESVVLADASADAVANAELNVERHGLASSCSVVRSDLFDAVPRQPFDLVLFNMPFLYGASDASELPLPTPEAKRDVVPPPSAFMDVEYATIRRFFAHVGRFLAPDGVVRCTFGSFGNADALDRILGEVSMRRRTLVRHPEPEYGVEYMALEVVPERRA